MRKFASLSLAVVLCTLCFVAKARAQAVARQDIPPVLTAGMEAYKPGNPDQAIKAWTKNSPLDGSQAAADLVVTLRQAQSAYGAFQWFDVISNREISPRVRILYVTMNYDGGPLFGRFVFFHTDRGWIVTSFDFNLDDSKIVPVTVE